MYNEDINSFNIFNYVFICIKCVNEVPYDLHI